LFKRIEGLADAPAVTFQVDGRTLQARQGDNLALALLQAGVLPFRRSAVSGQPRAPLCLMGVCFDCLLQVDGQPNVQACLVTVREGLQVKLSQSPSAADDE
jgi:D-hydroxyproline dehydrogenase subunit gamma